MFWDTLRADIRHTLRLAVQDPASSPRSPILALALGIGATSAIFAVVNGVLLQPLPYRDDGAAGEHLEPQHQREPAAQSDLAGQLPRLRRRMNSDARRARGLLHLRHAHADASSTAAPEIAVTRSSPPNLFNMLGRTAALGRAFTAGEPARARGAQRRLLAAALRRRPRHRRPELTLTGQPAPGDRRDAAGFRVPVPRHARPERLHAHHRQSTCGCRCC